MIIRVLSLLLVLHLSMVQTFAASTTVGIANGTVSGDLDLGDILRDAAVSAGIKSQIS